MMKVVQGGRVAVDINGEREEFFRTYKGPRQGDPLPPLLFNLVGDALAAILNLANARGEIKGLVPHLVGGGLTHLQYADDTVIFLANSKDNLTRMKFMLYCFEAMLA